MRFPNTFIDNEPDYMGNHPWGLRPTRCLYYARYPLVFLNRHKYFVDDPNYVNALHSNMEKHYEELGYYPNRGKEADEE